MKPSTDSFSQERRIFSEGIFIDGENQNMEIDGISQIKDNFYSILETFPDQDIDSLKKQLSEFCSIFKFILHNKENLNDFQIQSLYFIHESNFPNIIYSLLMNQSLDPISQKKVLKLFSFLTLGIFSPENLTFIEDEEFLNQILFILQSEQPSVKILYKCLICIINILQFYPNSIFLLDKSGITNFIATELINSSDMITISESSRYILLTIQKSTDIEQKKFLLHQTIMKLIETKINKDIRRPLTYILPTVLDSMKENPDIRTLLIDEDICAKCVDIILIMKNCTTYSQNYGDLCIQILSYIANEGTEHEFQVLLESGVFDAFFAYKFNFLDLSPYINVDSDSFDYVCSFLIGIITRNDPNGNELLYKYEIFPQIRLAFFEGPTNKRVSSLFVIAAAVDTLNTEMCQLLLEDDSIFLIFEMLSTMSSDVLEKIIHILLKILDLMPEAKEIYLQNDLPSKLESFMLQQDQDEENIKYIEILLNYINED